MTAEHLTTLTIVAAAYLFPTIIAACRSHHNLPAILALNLLLGWTFLGWVASLIWALTYVKHRAPSKPFVPRMPSKWRRWAHQ